MRLFSTFLLLALLSAAPPRVLADPPQRVEPRLLLAQRDGPSLSEAVEQVRRQYSSGRIVSAETRVVGNREVHYIKVLTDDGRVITERIQGRTRDSR